MNNSNVIATNRTEIIKGSFVQNSEAIFNTPKKRNREDYIWNNNGLIVLSVEGVDMQPKHLSPLNYI